MARLLQHPLAQFVERGVRRGAHQPDDGAHGSPVELRAVAAAAWARRNVARFSCEPEQVTHEAEADAESGGESALRTFAAAVGIEHAAA